MNDQLANLPNGNGAVSRLFRDIDRRLRKIEPRETVGLLRQGSRNGVNLKPNSLSSRGSTSENSGLPRYR